MVILVALGFWNDGRREVLDWKALTLISGTIVPEQRYVFHTLQNVATACRSERKDQENRDLRKQVMEQAMVIYQAERACDTRTCLVEWAEQWREQAPQAVAILERGMEQTRVFYSISGLAPAWIRTTSLRENPNRELCPGFARR